MNKEYSAHPALASEQLQRAELAEKHQHHCAGGAHSYHHRRHNSASSGSGGGGGGGGGGAYCSSPKSKCNACKSTAAKTTAPSSTITNTNTNTEVLGSTAKFTTTDATPEKTLPDRTVAADACFSHGLDAADIDLEFVTHADEATGAAADDDADTKDCVDCVPSSFVAASAPPDETDSDLQHRFSRTAATVVQGQQFCSRHYDADDASVEHAAAAQNGAALSDGCPSGLSSAISSPSASTLSSPLSTPTRLAPHFHTHHSHQHDHPHCCQKPSAASTPNHHHHHHHAHTHHGAASSSAAGGCKKLQKLKKFDPRLGPSPYRQLLPIALCIISFASVFSILIVYMDTTEIRHQQFRLNMSRDYELYGVAQDDPTLIAFLREIHMRKYPMHFLKNTHDTTPAGLGGGGGGGSGNGVGGPSAAISAQNFNFSVHYDGLTPQMAHYVAELVGGKMNGAVIQSLPGALGHLMTAPWLSETLNWAGVIVEPEPRRYFTLRKQNAQRPRMQVVHACVSPNPYPKEVTIHNEDSEVRINSLLDEETSWFNSRVKCFPLYTIMLACNRVEYDLLSLGVHGHELEILQTLPFDKIKIEVISIHLPDERDDIGRGYIQALTKFLMGKSYRLQKKFGRNYFYQRLSSTSASAAMSTSRTRKKDILLLKTP